MLSRSLLFGLPLCVAAAAHAQSGRDPARWSGYWAPNFAADPAESGLIPALPADAILIDDAGGGELGSGEFGGLALSERALAQIRNYDYAEELLPENACRSPSVALYMQAPFPLELHVGRDLVVMRLEYFDHVRVIFLDGRAHPPAGAPHTLSGHSVGRWEGDTLVVDTTHIAPGSFMNNGFDHGPDLHLVERFRVSDDGSELWATQVYIDAATFRGTAARFIGWSRRDGEYIYPYDCDPGYQAF